MKPLEGRLSVFSILWSDLRVENMGVLTTRLSCYVTDAWAFSASIPNSRPQNVKNQTPCIRGFKAHAGSPDW